MKRDKAKDISKKIHDDILGVGLAFDKVPGPEEQWNTLIMLLTGFLIEMVKEDHYETALKDLASDALDSVRAFKEAEEHGDLLVVETKGNA